MWNVESVCQGALQDHCISGEGNEQPFPAVPGQAGWMKQAQQEDSVPNGACEQGVTSRLWQLTCKHEECAVVTCCIAGKQGAS